MTSSLVHFAAHRSLYAMLLDVALRLVRGTRHGGIAGRLWNDWDW